MWISSPLISSFTQVLCPDLGTKQFYVIKVCYKDSACIQIPTVKFFQVKQSCVLSFLSSKEQHLLTNCPVWPIDDVEDEKHERKKVEKEAVNFCQILSLLHTRNLFLSLVHFRTLKTNFHKICQCLQMNTGMLRHSLGVTVIFFSLQHFIAPAVD